MNTTTYTRERILMETTKPLPRSRTMDELSRHTRRQLQTCLEAHENIESIRLDAARLPRGRVVSALLQASRHELSRSFDKILDKERTRAKRDAQTWARQILDDPDTVILDSETTGLFDPIDFVEISVIDVLGNTLFDSRTRPVSFVEHHATRVLREKGEYEDVAGERVRRAPVKIEPGAISAHGILPEDLRAAPSFAKVYPELLRVLEGKRVAVYNAPYDAGVWDQAVERYRLPAGGVDTGAWECLMRARAAFFSEYRYDYEKRDPTPTSFRWQALNGRHRALGDCRKALLVLHEMAGREKPELDPVPPLNPIPLRILNAPPKPPRPIEEDFDNIPF